MVEPNGTSEKNDFFSLSYETKDADGLTKKQYQVSLEPWEFERKGRDSLTGVSFVINTAKVGGSRAKVYLDARDPKVLDMLQKALDFARSLNKK